MAVMWARRVHGRAEVAAHRGAGRRSGAGIRGIRYHDTARLGADHSGAQQLRVGESGRKERVLVSLLLLPNRANPEGAKPTCRGAHRQTLGPHPRGYTDPYR